MIVYSQAEYPQGSLQWAVLRAGIPTASEFDQLVTKDFEMRKGQMPASYLAAKLAEKWQGGPLPAFSGFAAEQGQFLEREAIPWYEVEMSEDIQRVGFITTDDGKVGCSPDGLLGDNCGIEIKCPEAQTQVRYLLDGVVPNGYLAQVHGSMYVTGRETWRFLSYRRHFPPLLLLVERDDEIQEKLHGALTLFCGKLDRAYERLCEINGGPPVRTRNDFEPQAAKGGEEKERPEAALFDDTL